MEHRMYRAVQNGNSQRYVPRDYNNQPHKEQEATKRKFRFQFWRVSEILQFEFTACFVRTIQGYQQPMFDSINLSPVWYASQRRGKTVAIVTAI